MSVYSNSTHISTRSPFSVYEDERLNVIESLMSKNLHLNDLDKLILLSVDEMLVTTSNLLNTHFGNIGLICTDITTVRRSLKKLSDNGYLVKMEFVTPTSCSLGKVYALGTLGQEFILSKGKTPCQTGYIASLDALRCKKLLAAAQFVIKQNYITEAVSVTFGEVAAQRKLDLKDKDINSFRPHGTVQFNDKTVFVESVRSNCGSVNELIEKLSRMNNILMNSKYLNIPIKENVGVVIVCESLAHQLTVAEALHSVKERYCFKISLTNDIDVYNKPSDCLYPFEQNGWVERIIAVIRRSSCNKQN